MTNGELNISRPKNPETVLVIGATSSLAQSICRVLAARGHTLILAGRNAEELGLLAADLFTRFHTPSKTCLFDFTDPDFSAAALIESAGPFDRIIIATGDIGNRDPLDVDNFEKIAYINYIMPAQFATAAGESLITQGHGSLVIISSVAGDRGRQSNYIYGSAKAALSTFAAGLRNRLYHHDIHVMTVKPGFIDTSMTWGMQSKLIARRETAARIIVDAMENRKRQDVLYVPRFWQFLMLAINTLPERYFKRLRL